MKGDFLDALRHVFSEKEIAGALFWSEIAFQITACREALGMTQKELARRVGVSARKIQRIENCGYDPKLSLLSKIFGELVEKRDENDRAML